MHPPRSTGALRAGPRRLAAWVAALVGCVGGGLAAIVPLLGGAPPAPPAGASAVSGATWYAPYVDATLPPEYASANPTVNPARQTAFGFIVAASAGSCVPSWGTYYSLSGVNGSPLQLGSVIQAMKAEGEVPIVSFGGEANQPLADVCTSASALATAYQQVVDAYGLRVIDLDIEGAAQGSTAALAIQAEAIRQVQAEAAAQGSPLGVWLTLPVATTGMLPVAEGVVDAMLAGGVRLSGVNLMTMYFSPSPGDGAPMLASVESALTAAHGQLQRLFASHGLILTSAQLWGHMGATIQIGQASIPDQAFTVADAQGLVSFAETNGLGRVSDWSANEDAPCGSASNPTVGGYSNFCSGVVQTPGQFGAVLSQLRGSALSTPLLPAVTSEGASLSPTPPSRTSPPPATTTPPPPPTTTPPPTVPMGPVAGSFPAWSASTPYPAGSTVVREGNVYRARWWSQGQDPAQPVGAPWDTPWSLVGPVAAGSAPWSPPALPGGTYPGWSSSAVYVAGDDVLFQGSAYQAKWWNQGDSPGDALSDPYGSPWKPLFSVPGSPRRGCEAGEPAQAAQTSAGASTRSRSR